MQTHAAEVAFILENQRSLILSQDEMIVLASFIIGGVFDTEFAAHAEVDA